jgi:hypothetical protein
MSEEDIVCSYFLKVTMGFVVYFEEFLRGKTIGNQYSQQQKKLEHLVNTLGETS